MKPVRKTVLSACIAVLALAAASCVSPDPPVQKYISDLGSPDAPTVYMALEKIRKLYPTDPAAQAAIKPLLADKRINVRRQAVLTIGAIRAPVNQTDLDNIAAFLDSKNPNIVFDGLEALRNLDAASEIPRIVPLLQDSHHAVVLESIRALAALGDRSLIPTLQPLANSSDKEIRAEAAYAIELL
ncbi:MAG TPA: HEAT repeat domain-containing protein, partial [Verrucomicrobiae bacterium]|nr:HEAT repeat domain-containing protein [Verrucomicrobiae bacterium]